MNLEREKILIIDGDLIAYRYAAAAEERSVIVKHLKTGKEKEFKNRTEFKDLLKEKGMEYKPEAYQIVDVQKPEDVSFALGTIKRLITKLQDFSWCDRTEIYLGSGKTFRHSLPLPTPYKDNRDGLLKPVHLDAARDYMKSKYNAKIISDIEVDDMVTIRAYEELSQNNEPILVSVDKDSYQSQGVVLLNWMHEEWKLEKIPEVGTLYKDKAAIKGSGLKFLAFQTLAGDNADTYCGYQLSKLKYGPTKAMKALESAKTEQEVMQVLVNEYKRLYPDPVEYTDCHGQHHVADWYDLLKLYWQCAYMKRSRKDTGDIKEFCKQRGIEIEIP